MGETFSRIGTSMENFNKFFQRPKGQCDCCRGIFSSLVFMSRNPNGEQYCSKCFLLFETERRRGVPNRRAAVLATRARHVS